jgi:hypothetical protein
MRRRIVIGLLAGCACCASLSPSAAEDWGPAPLPTEDRLYTIPEIPAFAVPLDTRTELRLGARVGDDFRPSGLDTIDAWTIGIRARW